MPAPEPLQEYLFTGHALSEIVRRGIDKDEVAAVLANPEQSEPVLAGRILYQSKIFAGDP
jgi:hypothetical protein